MMKPEEKIAAVDRLLDELRFARSDPTYPEYVSYHALREIAADLRAKMPAQIGVVRQALQFQTKVAKRHYAQHGCYAIGHAMTICEALCGKWGTTIEKALEHFEREAVS